MGYFSRRKLRKLGFFPTKERDKFYKQLQKEFFEEKTTLEDWYNSEV